MPSGFGVGGAQPMGAPTQKTGLVPPPSGGTVHEAFNGSAMHADTSPGDALQFKVASRSASQLCGDTNTPSPLGPHVTATDVAPTAHTRYEARGLRKLDGAM